MSRSYKKSPCITWAGGSNKKDKRLSNQKFRANEKQTLHNVLYEEDIDDKNLPCKQREVMNNFNFTTDGLALWYNDLDDKWKRK